MLCKKVYTMHAEQRWAAVKMQGRQRKHQSKHPEEAWATTPQTLSGVIVGMSNISGAHAIEPEQPEAAKAINSRPANR